MRTVRIDLDNVGDIERFVRFPFALYEGCSQWVPPLLSQARLILDRDRHPFYQHAVAAFFLVEEDDRTLGRVGVMDYRRRNERLGTNSALFGFFETEDDADVALRLIDAAADWARSRGLREVLGPRTLLSTDAGGVLVDGFEYRPAMGVAYNYPYYDRLLKRCGFRKQVDILSGYLHRDTPLPERLFEIAEKVKIRRGLRIKSFRSKREMRRWVPRIGRVYTQAFAQRPDFCPPTPAEMDLIAEQLLAIADPQLIKLVLKGEDVVGFLFAYPDISAGLQRCGGRLWPLGWFHLLRERRRTDWVNINGLGVLPAHQGLGVNALLYAEMAKTIREHGFVLADVVAVGEDNAQSRADLETIGVQWHKKHRSYEMSL